MVPCSNTTVIYIHGVEISQQTVHYSRTTRISTAGMRNTSRNTESRTVTAIVSPILMFLSSNCYSTPNALNTSCGGGARWHRNALVWSNNRSHYRQTCSAQCSAAVVIIFLYRRRYAGVARSAAANTPGSRLRCGAARPEQCSGSAEIYLYCETPATTVACRVRSEIAAQQFPFTRQSRYCLCIMHVRSFLASSPGSFSLFH